MLTRHSKLLNPALTASSATTEELENVAQFAGGQIIIPAGSPITSLTYYVAEKKGGTYVPLYDSTGTAVTQTVSAGKAYSMPSAIYGSQVMKIVVNSAGSVYVSLIG